MSSDASSGKDSSSSKPAPNTTPLSCSQEALSKEFLAEALDSVLHIAKTVNAPVQPKKKRCAKCNKRVGLTGFECRCGGLYCSEHRYDKAHDCTFDYKTVEREELRRKNPVVVGDKIRRI